LGSRNVIAHVTNGLAVVTFLLVVNDDHASILHRYGDIRSQSCVQPMLWSKSLLRMPGDIFRVPDAILLIHYNFYGPTMTIKGNL